MQIIIDGVNLKAEKNYTPRFAHCIGQGLALELQLKGDLCLNQD